MHYKIRVNCRQLIEEEHWETMGLSNHWNKNMLNQILKGFVAHAVGDFAPLPTEVAEDLWVLGRRVSFPGGAQLPIRSTIVRLKKGSVVVISAPPNVDAKCAAKIASIGAVQELVAPNTFH